MADNTNPQKPRFITLHRGGRKIVVALHALGNEIRRQAGRVAAIPGHIANFAAAQRDAAIEAIAVHNPTDIAGQIAQLSAAVTENLLAMAIDRTQQAAERNLVEMARRQEQATREYLRHPIAGVQKAIVGDKFRKEYLSIEPLPIKRDTQRLQREFVMVTVRRHLAQMADKLRRDGLSEFEIQRRVQKEAEILGTTHAPPPSPPRYG